MSVLCNNMLCRGLKNREEEQMTNNEVKNTLKELRRTMDMMDKSHIKNLLKILMNAQGIKNCAFFLSLDMRKITKKLLSDFIKSDFVNVRLSRRQMKQIYQILGDYRIYPKCGLCGQPILIDSDYMRYEPNLDKMAFSWDHMNPKSMGGSDDLENMQPTHKICNNKRGTTPAYDQNCSININISIKISLPSDMCCQKYRPSRFGLCKYVNQNCCCGYQR